MSPKIIVTAEPGTDGPELVVTAGCDRSTLLTTQTVVHDHRGESAVTAETTAYLHQVQVSAVIDGEYRDDDVRPHAQRLGTINPDVVAVEARYRLEAGTKVTFVASCPCEQPVYSPPMRAPSADEFTA